MSFATNTCDDCTYQVSMQCRRFPPVASADTAPPYGYPMVTPTTPACGEYVVLDITPPIA